MDEPRLVTNHELLLQVLRNQMAIIGLLGDPGKELYLAGAGLVAETIALLDRAEAKIEPT